MATIVGIPSSFNTVSIGGSVDHGTHVTNYGLDRNFHVFEDDSSGYLGIGTRPAFIKQNPQLTFAGYLSTVNAPHLRGAACPSGTGGTATTDPTEVAMVYGSSGQGYTTSGCVVSSIQITGRPNELVSFSAEMFGEQTTVTGGPGADNSTVGFYPWELGTYGTANTLFGFSINYTTGYYPLYAMDGNQYYSGVGERLHTGTVEITMAAGATAAAEYTKYTTRAAAQFSIVLAADNGGSGVTLTANGYYTDFNAGDQDGLYVATATLTMHYTAAALPFIWS